MYSLTAAQICDFYVIVSEKDIFWFDIAMENAILVHVIYGLEDLKHVVFNLLGV